MRTVPKSPILLPAILAALSLPLIRGLAEAPPDGADFFAKNIQPLFKEHCYKCHSHGADKIKGGLVLDSLDGALTGGDTGPAIVPGDPAKSLLITAVGYRDEDLQMPPKGKKLADDQIVLLTEWVKMGAPWPKPANGQKMTVRARGKITDEDRQWWAFQPLAHPEPPVVEDGGWAVNEIDCFVFQKLTAAGLAPASRAKPEQLIRRIYFDVIGLPPTPEESAAFVSDSSHRSHESQTTLVDKLLAESALRRTLGASLARPRPLRGKRRLQS